MYIHTRTHTHTHTHIPHMLLGINFDNKPGYHFCHRYTCTLYSEGTFTSLLVSVLCTEELVTTEGSTTCPLNGIYYFFARNNITQSLKLLIWLLYTPILFNSRIPPVQPSLWDLPFCHSCKQPEYMSTQVRTTLISGSGIRNC